MPLLVDTSVWSLAYRRDALPDVPEVRALREALGGGDAVVTTGIILLELLRGFVPERAQQTICADLGVLESVEPRWADYEAAAELRNACRRHGVHLGAVDSLLAQLAIAHELTLLTTDRDFVHAAACIPLRVWMPGQ
ncbi:PIN domain-containing protein [Microbacterium sp.]|uniref:type II toxin-antitoxin system VapC family toxin n=1 Tax=Microbacterium sp. TaxID=51671 RepID=UPI0039E2F750